MQLNHIHLKARNVDSLASFYQKYFGMKILDQNKIEIYLGTINGSWLTISTANNEDLPLPSWFHFGFCLSTKDEVRNLYSIMKEDRLTFPRELTEFGAEGLTFYVLDPEGNRVEISWIKAHQVSRSSALA